MRIRFSFFQKHTILALTLLLSFSPNLAASYGPPASSDPNASAEFAEECVRTVVNRPDVTGFLDAYLSPNMSIDDQDKQHAQRKIDELATGRMAAVCELMFGASVWKNLSTTQVGLGIQGRVTKELATYKAVMAADKTTQQALVKDYLKTLFDMDAEGISAGMAQLAAQEKKQEEKEKEVAAKKEAADDAVNKQLKNGGNIDTKQMNTQTYVDENGNKGTLWCNPGPCTLGSATKHGWISGAGTLLPEELVGAVTKILTRDSETSSSAIRSEIFNITLKTIKEAAEKGPRLSDGVTATQLKKKLSIGVDSPGLQLDSPTIPTSAEGLVPGVRTLYEPKEEAASPNDYLDMSCEGLCRWDETNEPIMRYTDANGNKGTLWCNPGPCTAGSPLKHGWATGVGTFLPLKLVEDVKKTLGEAVNKEIATFSSATNRKIFNITKDALLASAETSDDPKLKSAAAMTTTQIKSNQVANEKSQEDKSGNLVEVEEAPVVEAPVEEAPVLEAPVLEAPVLEAPVVEAPVLEAPVLEAPVVEAPVLEAPVLEAPVLEAPVVEAPVEEDHHHDDGTEAPVDEGTEAPVEEWDDDCLGMEQCNIPIVR